MKQTKLQKSEIGMLLVDVYEAGLGAGLRQGSHRCVLGSRGRWGLATKLDLYAHRFHSFAYLRNFSSVNAVHKELNNLFSSLSFLF